MFGGKTVSFAPLGLLDENNQPTFSAEKADENQQPSRTSETSENIWQKRADDFIRFHKRVKKLKQGGIV